MSRNRYTRLIHDQDEAPLNHRIRDLRRLARTLRYQPVGMIEPAVELPIVDRKTRRRARIEQNRCHKPELPSANVIAITPPESRPTSNAVAA